MEYLHSTPHLGADWLDRVWLARLGEGPVGPHFVGYLGDGGLAWPTDFGDEPNWWITEIGELEDAWQDGARFARDYRATVQETWNRSRM